LKPGFALQSTVQYSPLALPRQSPYPAFMSKALEIEPNKRRVFAIISHPDAGKTTLTENMLLGISGH